MHTCCYNIQQQTSRFTSACTCTKYIYTNISGASDSLERPGCWFTGGGATVASERGQI